MHEPYLNCMICIFMKLGSEAGAYTQLPPLARTMATISSRVEIAYQEEKPVLIPKEHIINSMDKQWLRLRLTSQPIIQLLAGQNIAKNSSLSGSQGLTAIIAARNKEYDKEPPAAEQEDQPAEALFDEPVPKSRKRVNSQEPEQVTIEVQGQAINCLMSGQRPRGTDLTIELDNNQIAAIIKHCRAAAIEDSLQQSKRSYNKRARQ